jgi:AraC-type transcriptional regulator N-terminus
MDETARLRDLIRRHACEGLTQTALPGVSLLRAAAVTEPLGEVAEPAVAVIAQGAKATALNGRVFPHGAGQFAIVPVELPVVGHITQASFACASNQAMFWEETSGQGSSEGQVVYDIEAAGVGGIQTG